jgi:hypothetical protein
MDERRVPAMVGVEGKLKDLKLSETEKKSVKIGRKQACFSSVGKLQAVGKIFSERHAKAEYVGRTLGGLWSPFSGVECKDLGRNRFLFSFHDEISKDRAIEDGPWRFNKDLIVMEDFKPSKTIDDYEFKTIPIWVRAYGIPMGMMDSDTGELVGEHIGQFIEVDLDHNGNAMGEFLRIKVRMDITKPITRFITLEIEDEESEQDQTNDQMMSVEENGKKEKEMKFITFKYEYLPDFCYSCGIIGHTEIFCPARTRREGARQFGPELRAIIYTGNSSEEKSRSSSDRGNFWLTNSDGNKGNKQGSDGPSWRKSIQSGRDEYMLKRERIKKSQALW